MSVTATVAWKIRSDDRVVLRERTNIRHLTPDDLYANHQTYPDLGVMDVSFISLGKVLPAFWALLQPPREVVLLVKPQFEVGKAKIGKNGVVRNPNDQADAIATVLGQSQTIGWHYQGLTHSPLQGPAGNIEYLLWLTATPTTPIESPTDSKIQQITRSSPSIVHLKPVKIKRAFP